MAVAGQDARYAPDEVIVRVRFASSQGMPDRDGDEDLWTVDSGASRHMASDKGVFGGTLRSLPVPTRVEYGDGKCLRAEGVGDVHLDVEVAGACHKLVLHDVLWVPESQCGNLLSVSQAHKLSGAEFQLGSQCVVFVDGCVVASAPMADNHLYVLRSRIQRHSACMATVKPPVQLWHKRFGHLGYRGLARLVGMVTGIGIPAAQFEAQATTACDECEFSKGHRLPFPEGRTPSTTRLAK